MQEQFILTADIGGTNTHIGIFSNNTNNYLQLILQFDYKTKEIKNTANFAAIIKQKIKEQYNQEKLSFSTIVIAAAGPIDHKKQEVLLTNHWLTINAKKLKNLLGTSKIYLLNDFEALGYSINLLQKEQERKKQKKKQTSIVQIKKGIQIEHKTIALLGAGTGLGKSIIIYNKQTKTYIPLASEGGHADFAVQNYFELQLADFIKKQKKQQLLCCEDLLSGKGLVNIYYFLCSKYKYILKPEQIAVKKEIDNADDKPAAISKNKKTDFLCKETMKLFSKYYAITVRNFALETLPHSGIYIAGGIAQKNNELLNKDFITTFETQDTYKKLLRNIPIYLITNPTASLYGCAWYAIRQ